MGSRMNRSETPDQKGHREQQRTKTDSPVLVVAHWSRQPADVIPGRFLHVLGQFKMFRSDTMQAGCHVDAENIPLVDKERTARLIAFCSNPDIILPRYSMWERKLALIGS